MFQQRKFIQMLTIYFIGILSISNAQINSPEEPQSPKLIPEIDDAKVYELHQYLLDNKSIFKNHLILMSHPKYYILLNEIIKKMNEVILYNNDQPVIDKKELKNIGLVFEDLHFVDFNQLKIQIKNRIIDNKINSIISQK